MAIDVFSEEVVSFSQASKRLPSVTRGRNIHVSSIWRWTLAGKKCPDGSVARLETIKIGGTTCTSIEALQRFFDRITGEREIVTPPTLTERQRRKRSEAADRRLREEFGL